MQLKQLQRGSVLIYALVLMSLLLSSALSLSTLSLYGAQTSRRLIDSIPAYYASESCMEQLLNRYVGQAGAAHIYIQGDPTIPTGANPRDPVTNQPPVVLDFTSWGGFGISGRCPPRVSTTTAAHGTTASVTITTYGEFGKSIEGLSATVTR